MSKPTGILEMDPARYREIDGVVFDLDSFARHCQTAEPPAPPAPAIAAPTGILAMDPDNYRAIDGVAMDAESYERHSRPSAADQPPAPADAPPMGVFPADPTHEGWYPATDGQPPVPVMGGALPPVEILADGTRVVTVVRTVGGRTGSGSGSYLTSYITSYRTSWRSSGSGSYVFGSCTFFVGGYGLELV